jgi:DNA-binding transcriptional regulator YiaG
LPGIRPRIDSHLPLARLPSPAIQRNCPCPGKSRQRPAHAPRCLVALRMPISQPLQSKPNAEDSKGLSSVETTERSERSSASLDSEPLGAVCTSITPKAKRKRRSRVWPRIRGGYTLQTVARANIPTIENSKDFLRSIRRSMALSQANFATLLGCSVRTVEHWENTNRKPHFAVLRLLWILQWIPKHRAPKAKDWILWSLPPSRNKAKQAPDPTGEGLHPSDSTSKTEGLDDMPSI